MSVYIKCKQNKKLTSAELLEAYNKYESSTLKKKKKKIMFSIYSTTKEKPYAPILHIVKGRNNDFLFGMQFSAPLVECLFLGEQKGGSACSLLKVSSVFSILSNTETKTMNITHYVRLSG